MGIRTEEVADVKFSEHGLEVTTAGDGNVYVFVGASSASDFSGHELMYRDPPHPNYRGNFPVLFDGAGRRIAGTVPPQQAATVPPAAPAPATAGARVDKADPAQTPDADPAERDSHAPHDPAAGPEVPPADPPPAPAVDLSKSVAEILSDVGSDAAVAAQVLEAEQAAAKAEKRKPRKTLVAGLESLVGSD